MGYPERSSDFCNLDVNDTSGFTRLSDMLDQENRVTINYFAMPPSTFGAICKGLGRSEAECQARAGGDGKTARYLTGNLPGN